MFMVFIFKPYSCRNKVLLIFIVTLYLVDLLIQLLRFLICGTILKTVQITPVMNGYFLAFSAKRNGGSLNKYQGILIFNHFTDAERVASLSTQLPSVVTGPSF